jgi:hypothetical protein
VFFAVVTKVAGQPAKATICSEVDLSTTNGSWIVAKDALDPRIQTHSWPLGVVQAIYEVETTRGEVD